MHTGASMHTCTILCYSKYYLSYNNTMYNNTPATMQGKSTMHRIIKIMYSSYGIVYYWLNPTYRMLKIMVQPVYYF